MELYTWKTLCIIDFRTYLSQPGLRTRDRLQAAPSHMTAAYIDPSDTRECGVVVQFKLPPNRNLNVCEQPPPSARESAAQSVYCHAQHILVLSGVRQTQTHAPVEAC